MSEGMQPSTTLSTKTALPLLALGRMDGGEDQIVLVQQRRARLVAGGAGRIEREVGEEVRARGVAAGDALQLVEIAGAHDGVGIALLEMRLIPWRTQIEFRRPSCRRAVQAPRISATRSRQAVGRLGRRLEGGERVDRRRGPPCGRAPCPQSPGRCPRSSCSTRKPVTRSAGFSAQRSTASMSLTCAASMNLRPPNLTNGMLRRVSSISSMALWCAVRNSTACSLSGMPASRFSRMRGDDAADLADVVGTVDERRLVAGAPVRAQVLGEALARQADDGIGRGQDRLRRAVVLLQRDDRGRRLEAAAGKSRMLRTLAARKP